MDDLFFDRAKLRHMTNLEIEKKLKSLTQAERRITAEIVDLIREADRRRLPLERGYPSLFAWLIKEFGYSHSAAYRRIQAARLQKDIPQLRQMLEDGSVNLSTLSQVQTAIRNHEKISGPVTLAEKAEVIDRITDKSSAEAEAVLAEIFPTISPKESLRRNSNDNSTLTVMLDSETRGLLEKLKIKLAHVDPQASWGEVIKYALKKVTQPVAAAAVQSERSQAQIRREILARGCEFRDPLTKRVCGSKFRLEVDHVVPRAKGGSDTEDNLRCLCRNHNLLLAERHFGRRKMEKYWRRN